MFFLKPYRLEQAFNQTESLFSTVSDSQKGFFSDRVDLFSLDIRSKITNPSGNKATSGRAPPDLAFLEEEIYRTKSLLEAKSSKLDELEVFFIFFSVLSVRTSALTMGTVTTPTRCASQRLRMGSLHVIFSGIVDCTARRVHGRTRSAFA